MKKHLFILSIIGVQLALFCVFYIYMNFNSILMAFQNTGSDNKLRWTLDNFRQFFSNFKTDETLFISLRNTLIFFILGFIMLPVSFTTSYFMYKKIWGARVFRVVFFFPSILSAVVWSGIFKYLVGADGPVAALHQIIMKLPQPAVFLADSRYALAFVVLYSVWMGIAGNFILFSGTLSRIPDGVIEAGKLDGIGWFRELTQIIVPLVWPMLATLVLLSLTGIFTASGNILLLTGGGYKTNTISYFIFQNVYGKVGSSNTYNYASAIGLFFTALTLPMVFLSRLLLNRVEDVTY